MKSDSAIDPFQRNSWYAVGDLRHHKKQLTFCRQKNSGLSSEIRRNKLPGAKLWNEELSPFCDLTQHLNLPDNTLFRLAPQYAEAVDFYIRLDRDISIQMTIADLHWGLLRNPGEAVHRTSELLGRDQFAFGGGDLQNVEGMWRSHPRVLELEDRLLACELGLQMAIRKKLEKPRKADWLTIYCRYFALQLIDGGEDRLEVTCH